MEQKQQDGVRPAEGASPAGEMPPAADAYAPVGGPEPGTARAPEGTFDFSGCTIAQLLELKDTLNPRAQPQRYEALCAEIARRAIPQHSTRARSYVAPGGLEHVHFSQRQDWWSGLRALIWRMPLYGAGTVRILGRELELQGWRLAWWRAPENVLLKIDLHDITAVTSEHNWLRLEYGDSEYLPPRPLEIITRSPEAAQRLLEQLPSGAPSAWEVRWAQRRRLKRALEESTRAPWMSWVLMGLCLVYYLVVAILGGHLGWIDTTQALDFGGSFGPLTLQKQWWRLASSAFLHWMPVHLLLNLWVLATLGRLTERVYGAWPFLLIYLASALVAGSVSLLWDPSVITLGASGALFGVLGSLTIFLLRQRRTLPHAIWRAHLPGSVPLVALGIASALANTVIDGAACLGGLGTGLLVGGLLMRPLQREARRAFPFKPFLGTIMFTPVVMAALLWRVTPEALLPAEQYFKQHEWYTRGAAAADARWQGLIEALHHGQISDRELQRRFEKEILPFWRSSTQRLQREAQKAPAAQKPVAQLLAELVQFRLGAATAAIAAVGGRETSRLPEMQRLSVQANLAQARLERVQLRITQSYRARGLKQSTSMLALMAHYWPPVCVRSTPHLETADPDMAGTEARVKAGCQAQKLFLSGDYAGLERQIRQASQKLGDLEDGRSTLSGIDAGLEDLFMHGTLSVGDALTRTAAWQQAFPSSALPDVVEARLFQSWARQARDPHRPEDSQGWLLWEAREAMAADSLADARLRGEPGPLWYALSLSIALEQSAQPEHQQAVFNEGVQRYPRYLPIYQQMLRMLAPLHSYEKIDSMIRDVSQTQTPTNAALYARLYLIYAALERDRINLFRDALAQWSIMKEGLAQLHQQYPASSYYLNAYARMACMADDLEQFASLRPQLEANPSPTLWASPLTLAACDAKRESLESAPQTPPGADAPGSLVSR